MKLTILIDSVSRSPLPHPKQRVRLLRHVQRRVPQIDPRRMQLRRFSCLFHVNRSLGEIQYQREEYRDAILSYLKVLELKPEYGIVASRLADSLNEVAVRLLDLGNSRSLDQARQLLQKAIALRPGVAKYYTNLGSYYYFKSDYPQAINILNTAVNLRPDEARAYYDLGHSYRAVGDRENAIASYSRYVAIGEKGEAERIERARKLIEQLRKSH